MAFYHTGFSPKLPPGSLSLLPSVLVVSLSPRFSVVVRGLSSLFRCCSLTGSQSLDPRWLAIFFSQWHMVSWSLGPWSERLPPSLCHLPSSIDALSPKSNPLRICSFCGLMLVLPWLHLRAWGSTFYPPPGRSMSPCFGLIILGDPVLACGGRCRCSQCGNAPLWSWSAVPAPFLSRTPWVGVGWC